VQFVAARRPRASGVRPPDGKVHGHHEFALADHHHQQDAINTGEYPAAISGDLLSAVISIRYIFGFRKDNPNVFNSLIQSWPHF
jgi:hypothetical protein